jgi:uncharacterized protein YneR
LLYPFLSKTFANPFPHYFKWGGSFAARTESSGFAKLAVEGGYATAEGLKEMADAWRAFVDDDDAWYGIMHGEIVCRK